MIVQAFAFFDRKGAFFSTPFFFPATPMAIRAANDLALDPGTAMGRHPSDYDLYRLGSYDDSSGAFSTDRPEFVCNCASFHKPSNQPNEEEMA